MSHRNSFSDPHYQSDMFILLVRHVFCISETVYYYYELEILPYIIMKEYQIDHIVPLINIESVPAWCYIIIKPGFLFHLS